jgi:hypothetical protein
LRLEGGGGQRLGLSFTQFVLVYIVPNNVGSTQSRKKLFVERYKKCSIPVPEIIDPVFAKTSPKRSFSITEYERFGLVFTKTRVYKFGHSFL